MKDEAPVADPSKLPLILLSHGTGGSALNMAWLGTPLASHGYVAVAVNHPGNNGSDGYTPQGFATWWERARDLSTAIGKMRADSTFGERLDPKRVGAAGFSLGGYTIIELVGGRTDPGALWDFCKSPRADGICKSPPEFPNLLDQWEQLSKTGNTGPATRRAERLLAEIAPATENRAESTSETAQVSGDMCRCT
jgi:predicted dienelactone hydrolase